MIGLYELRNASAALDSGNAISSFLSSASSTIATTLPNFVLSNPTLTTPAYTFNTSVPASVGEIVTSDLATSTYSPMLSAYTQLPNVSLSGSLQTFIITDTAGHTLTSTSVAPTITLGAIPGRAASAAGRLDVMAGICLATLSSLFVFLVQDSALLS